MSFSPSTRIGDLVLALPASMRLFEKRNLDYCCGGHRSLQEACAQAGCDAGEVLAALAALEAAPAAAADPAALAAGSLTDLIGHLVAKHHAFTREELARLAPLMAKVARVHGEHHPELPRIEHLFALLCDDLMPHLDKEERILFPFIRALEAGGDCGGACFGSVQGPIGVMQAEHEQAGEILREIRALSGEFTVPGDGCGSFRSLYLGLRELEEDLHLHIYLESHLLFPRAVELEAAAKAL